MRILRNQATRVLKDQRAMSIEFQIQNFRVLHPPRSCGQSIRSVGIVVGDQIATDRDWTCRGHRHQRALQLLCPSSSAFPSAVSPPPHLFFAPSRPAAIVAAPCLFLFLFSLYGLDCVEEMG
jgi:hypothetical protein